MPTRPLTLEQFFERARAAHGNRYGYDLVALRGSKTKVEIICHVHGSFFQQPAVHMRGQGCPHCYEDELERRRQEKEAKRQPPKPRGNPFAGKSQEEMVDIAARRKQTTRERYGVDNPSQMEAVKQKKRETSFSNFGVDNPMRSEEVKEKLRESFIVAYGVSNPMKMPSLVKRVQASRKLDGTQLSETLLRNSYQRLLQAIPSELEVRFSESDYVGMHRDEKWIRYPFRCCECGHEFERTLQSLACAVCPRCKPPSWVASAETQIREFIASLGIGTEGSVRDRIPPYELDIVIEPSGLAIEYNGLYWHAEISQGKTRSYHVNKLNMAAKAGLRLVSIFEDEWLQKREIVQNRLRYILGKAPRGPSARQCTLTSIGAPAARIFLEANHIQGGSAGLGSVRYGAFDGDRLVAAMTFCRPRIALGGSGGADYELLRFATDGSVHAGLASRMFKRFLTDYQPNSVVSYADLRWSDGGLYRRLGFDLVGRTEPGYWYTKDYVSRNHRYRFTKQVIVEKLGGDPALSEWQNMKAMGYDRIWDCGSLKFIWTRPDSL